MHSYVLQLLITEDYQYPLVDKILGINSNNSMSVFWHLEIRENEREDDFNFIRYFLSFLDGKYDELATIGIEREDISIWDYYEYEDQCNLEYRPEDLKKLGEEGGALCISCWEKKELPIRKKKEVN